MRRPFWGGVLGGLVGTLGTSLALDLLARALAGHFRRHV